MQPHKPKTDYAKGLARWGWIKRYLGPALKYAGISSRDFDIAVMGMDQFIKDKTAVANVFPHPQIEVGGTLYDPTGNEPATSNTSDGWWYIEFEWTPETSIFNEDDVGGEIYQWAGTIAMNTPPRYDFKAVETNSDTHDIDRFVIDSGTTGWTRVLVAKRTSGVVETFGNPTLITINLRGLWSVIETIA